MTIDQDNELARKIGTIVHMVRADGLHDYSAHAEMEWTSLCGLSVGVGDNGLTVLRAHNVDVRVQTMPLVNDNGGHTVPMMSVEFLRGTPSILAAWQRELIGFRTATMRVA